MPLLPGAEPFHSEGSGELARVGVLLIHGFTGTPQSMRPWAEYLAAAGLTVSLPRLPGHGTRWQDMQATRWPDWYAEAERGFDSLRGRCDEVFVMGLSMGGTLTLRLAEQRAGEVAGIVVVNASLATQNRLAPLAKVLQWVVPTQPGVASDIKAEGVTEVAYDKVPLKAFVSLQDLWKVTGADLGKIVCPILDYRSPEDHVVEPFNKDVLVRGAHATEVQEVVLPNSYHVATLDNDKETIFAGSLDFVRAHARTVSGG